MINSIFKFEFKYYYNIIRNLLEPSPEPHQFKNLLARSSSFKKRAFADWFCLSKAKFVVMVKMIIFV